MTKEQEKAIKEIKTYMHDYIMESFDDDGYTRYEISEEEQEFFNNIEKLLNMLKEKDAEIEMYKDIKEIANYKVTDLAKLKKTDEIQEELDKKNKIIDLYIDELVAEEFDNPCTECCQECEKDKDTLESCIKQYFERKAEETFNLEEFKKSMSDIYSTSVVDETIDEAPFVYKPMQEIIDNIQDTVEIEKIIKPIYNFKAKN